MTGAPKQSTNEQSIINKRLTDILVYLREISDVVISVSCM